MASPTEVTPTRQSTDQQFPWEQQASPASKATMLENRRHRLMAIMQQFADEGDNVQLGRLALEWNALTEARDKHIRGQFTREQKLLRAEKILALRTMLEDLCDEDTFESKSDTGIKLGVYGLLARVRAYCANNSISQTETSKLRQTADSYKAAFDSVKAPLAAAPPPPPPPPPPPMPPMPVAAPRFRIAPAGRKGKVQFRTPLKTMNNDIMSAISGANRGMLKQTPFKLSPGGTPAKGTKFASDDPADAITKALRSKFKNVNMASPLAGSPSVFSPAPLESSGSTPYAEPVFFVDHMAPKPKLNLAM